MHVASLARRSHSRNFTASRPHIVQLPSFIPGSWLICGGFRSRLAKAPGRSGSDSVYTTQRNRNAGQDEWCDTSGPFSQSEPFLKCDLFRSKQICKPLTSVLFLSTGRLVVSSPSPLPVVEMDRFPIPWPPPQSSHVFSQNSFITG